jgi:hypothetical protein
VFSSTKNNDGSFLTPVAVESINTKYHEFEWTWAESW